MTDETYNLLERAAQVQLENVIKSPVNEKDGKVAMGSTNLVELLVTADKDNADYYDKKERRRIEEERNKASNEIESNKQKLTVGRVAFEISKVVIPAVIGLIGYNKFQKRVITFEETGRLVSTAARELHLPKFMK